MRLKGLFIQILPVLVFLAVIAGLEVGPQPVPALHAHPFLMRLAAEQPERIITIVVQKTGYSQDAEEQTRLLGGVIRGELRLMNAFIAELPAGAVPELACHPAVRWVSPDRLVEQAGGGMEDPLKDGLRLETRCPSSARRGCLICSISGSTIR